MRVSYIDWNPKNLVEYVWKLTIPVLGWYWHSQKCYILFSKIPLTILTKKLTIKHIKLIFRYDLHIIILIIMVVVMVVKKDMFISLR